MKWGIVALVVCWAAVTVSATTRRLSVPTRPKDDVKTGMMHKQEAPKSKRPSGPSLYMRTANANRNRNEGQKQMRVPNRSQKKEEGGGGGGGGGLKLSIPRGRPKKRLQLSVPRGVPGMSDSPDAQRPTINAHAKVGPEQKAPQLRVPGARPQAKEGANQGAMQLSVPSLRTANQKNKRPFRLRVPQDPKMVAKVQAEGRTKKRRHGIQLSVPRQDVKRAKKRGPALRVPSLPMSQRRSDAGSGLPSISNLKKKKAARSRRSADEGENDFLVEDHVVRILDEAAKLEKTLMEDHVGKILDETDKLERSALEVEETPAAAAKPKTRMETNKANIQGRVRAVIGNVMSSMEKMLEEKELLEEDLKRLMTLPVKEEDLQNRIHAKLERIYEKVEEQAEDKAKLTEYMDDEIQWDDELSRRMDEELDAYEMERIRSEVEWRREQQKADKIIRANFNGESQAEEEEKSLLSMLEERIRELNELRNNPKVHRYDYEDDYY